MVDKKDVLSFNYYTYGEPFSGSDSGLRYRIERVLRDDEKIFLVSVWKDIFSYEKTDRSEIRTEEFEFSDLGLTKAVGWINSQSFRNE